MIFNCGVFFYGKWHDGVSQAARSMNICDAYIVIPGLPQALLQRFGWQFRNPFLIFNKLKSID